MRCSSATKARPASFGCPVWPRCPRVCARPSDPGLPLVALAALRDCGGAWMPRADTVPTESLDPETALRDLLWQPLAEHLQGPHQVAGVAPDQPR